MTSFPADFISVLQRAEAELFAVGSELSTTGLAGRRWWIRQDGKSATARARSVLRRLRQLEAVGSLSLPAKTILLAIGVTSAHQGGVRADAVCLRSNFRAFYLQDRSTLKVSNPSFLSRLEGEATIRRAIRQTKEVVLPKILAAFPLDECFCILEDLIFGRALQKPDIGPLLARGIWNFYEENGIAGEPLADTVDLDRARQSVVDAASFLHQDTTEVLRFLDHNEVIREGDSVVVPIGRCHGDLGRSNLVDAGGMIYLLDLERSRIGFLWQDLAKLSLQSRAFFAAAEASYHDWCKRLRFPAVPATDLLAIALINSVHRYWQDRPRQEAGNGVDWREKRLRRLFLRLRLAARLAS